MHTIPSEQQSYEPDTDCLQCCTVGPTENYDIFYEDQIVLGDRIKKGFNLMQKS